MAGNYLGIELGSTRIKSVLIDDGGRVLASGAHAWENRLEAGVWTYSLEEVWTGLRASYAVLREDYEERFGKPAEVSGIGISAMMHGYLAFDATGNPLAPFRTWRNTMTGEAAEQLTRAFGFNIPQRWSVAHYYQAVLNGEAHVKRVRFLTTLAGYVHWKLTGRRALGIGDASGMFPVLDGDFDPSMLEVFDCMLKARGLDGNFRALLPEVLCAGREAGALTEEGAALLDGTGTLSAGIPFCPPEGDAGTGMVATDSVAERTGNVSAGTSAFVMAVLERPLSRVYPEIDVVATPAGRPVAMVHVNNFSSELNAWTGVFREAAALAGAEPSEGAWMTKLFEKSAEADPETGGLTGYNFLSGEHIAGVSEGRPLFARRPEGKLTLANFMKMQIYSALGTLRLGIDILGSEGVRLDSVNGHGGFFKTERIGQSAMSAAVGAPVTVLKNAGEGGAWGIALLALFSARGGGNLEAFLAEIFAGAERSTLAASAEERAAFGAFMDRYRAGLGVEKLAVEAL